MRKPAADCSQWGNRMDYPDHVGERVLMLVAGTEIRSLGPAPDLSFHDGHNMQRQQSKTRDADTGKVLVPATVAQLKTVARDLPAAIAKLLEETRSRAEAEAREADAIAETI